ncbi:ring-like zinc finger domain containing protein [Nitzschia inconspicua]|uniref:Ring-like zinc finger domain containing protein n=1 Tax=Nitzschia inconspicua TaxID=303405 RepID=A0A9K3P8X2_9STRA|nr:ring-like zinc finger domain containing protein [Nitzschia inconspicua]KAG7367111.1 ring-like zinc finger domain containing protein [Nitzschia inconspicua]
MNPSPTFPPNTTDILPCPTSHDTPCETADFHLSDEAMWMIIWIAGMLMFLCLPFCVTKSRRDLCWRRIKERQWISDDREDDWYTAAVRRQQEQRRQQMEAEQRHFRTSRTQEDEIREQFLLQCMENYTMSLSRTDIHEMEETNSRAGSIKSFGSLQSFRCSKKIGDESESGIVAIDVEAQIAGSERKAKEKRSDSLTDDEEEQAVLAFAFDDNCRKVYVPLPGQTTMDAEETVGAPSARRMVNSGCAICLCTFDTEEKITWSANPKCPHIFHSDCILHWYLAVGRKTQRRHIRQNPEMSDEELLTKICDFPINCPCCRQNFCQDIRKFDVSASSSRTQAESESDEEMEQPRNEVDSMELGSTPSATASQ